MAYHLHSGAGKIPSDRLPHQNQTNRLPNRPCHWGAALGGVTGDGDASTAFEDEHFQLLNLPGQTGRGNQGWPCGRYYCY